MNKFFKNLVFIICGGLSTIGNTSEKVTESGPQTAVLTADGAEVTKELQSKTVVVLKDVEVCVPSSRHLSPDYNFLIYCPRGICQSILEFNKSIPKSLTLHRQYQGKCVQQTIPNLEPYQTHMYFTKISIDSDLAKKLNIAKAKEPNVKRTQNSTFIFSEMIRIGDKAIVTLKYGKDPLPSDEFLYESKLIRIKYTNGPTPPPAIAPPIPSNQLPSSKVEQTASKPSLTLQLTVNGGVEKILKFGSSNKFSIAGGQPGQVLVPRCEGPMNPCPGVSFIFQARVTLNAEGKQEFDNSLAEGSGIQPGQYKFWLATFDGSAETNKVSITVQRQ